MSSDLGTALSFATILGVYLCYLKMVTIEKKLNQLANHLHAGPISQHTQTKIEMALLQGDRLHAIRLYREETGLGLKEADDYIRQIEQKPLTADAS